MEVMRTKLLIKSSSLEDLNEDLLIEILCRLPCKHVVQCKCVSKNWLCLIQSPKFVASFSSMNNLPWAFIYSTCWEMKEDDFPKLTSNNPVFESPGFSLRFLPFYSKPQQRGYPEIRILKTYNDLILCCEVGRLQNVYYICNPVTMKWVSLPPTPRTKSRVCVDFVCELKKDDQKKHHKYIFKVVRVRRQHRTTKIKMQIFSSEIGRWKEISTSVFVSDDFGSVYIEEAIICNEKLILLGFMKESRRVWRNTNIYIIIDDIFNGEVCSVHHYHVFDMSFNFYPHSAYYGLCRMPAGGLRMAGVFKFESHPLIRIWEFKEDNYEWRLLQEVSLKDLCSDDEWVSKNYLKNIFILFTATKDSDDEEMEVPVPFVLGFDPYDVNILYLHLHCGGRMGKYDIRRKSLSIVEQTRLAFFHDGEAFPLVLQLPTPVFEVKRGQNLKTFT